MFFLRLLPKLMMIRQNSDRFPKHLCYKNVISFPSLWFSHKFYVQHGVVASEAPEVRGVSRASIIKYLGSVYLAIHN